MRDKPDNIHVSGFFLQERQDHQEAKEEIEKSWLHTHRNGRKDMGPRGCVSLEPHLPWVQAKEIQLKMPYPREEPLDDMFMMTNPLLLEDVEELQLALVRMKQ